MPCPLSKVFLPLIFLILIGDSTVNSCTIKFSDIPNKALLVPIILLGKIEFIFPAKENGSYNATMSVRRVLKGQSLQAWWQRNMTLVGTFNKFAEPHDNCEGKVIQNKERIFFLRQTAALGFLYSVTSPITVQKKNIELIKDITCLTCTSPPLFTSQLSDKTVREGSVLELVCVADGRPMPYLKWYHETREVNQFTYRGISLNYEGNSLILKLKDITRSQAGSYSCEAFSAIGKGEISMNLRVLPHEIASNLIQRAPVLRICEEDLKNYCLNNGVCYKKIAGNGSSLDAFCECKEEYTGMRCEMFSLMYYAQRNNGSIFQKEIQQLALKFFLYGIGFVLLIFIVVVIIGYFMWKCISKKTEKPHPRKTVPMLTPAMAKQSSDSLFSAQHYARKGTTEDYNAVDGNGTIPQYRIRALANHHRHAPINSSSNKSNNNRHPFQQPIKASEARALTPLNMRSAIYPPAETPSTLNDEMEWLMEGIGGQPQANTMYQSNYNNKKTLPSSVVVVNNNSDITTIPYPPNKTSH